MDETIDNTASGIDTEEQIGLPGDEVQGSNPLMLRTENLVKRYGKRTVVNHVSIDVKQGEIVGLLGPNGAGKTTTFYMTVGLVVPNEGEIFIGDQNITRFPVYKRAQHGIGYLAQEASIFRKMTVEDNIRSVLEFTDKSPEEQKEKLESLIEEFGLEKVRKNRGDRLSGGERRRSEIARCLAIDPKFIMLDEPFAGIDPIAVQDIQSIVARLKYRNIGILITDHNVDETLSITDRAYLLFEGKVLFQGSAEELAANPIVREKYLGNDFELRKRVFETHWTKVARLLSIDYGKKRTGLAVSDPLQLIANGLTTVETPRLFDFLADYFEKEEVERVIVGLPRQMDNEPSENMKRIEPFVNQLRKLYPHMPVEYYDERFTSKMAQQAIIDAGLKKKERQRKELVDEISATILLQGYMESRRNMSI